MKTQCPKCCKFHTQRRGFRILKNGKKQVYNCIECGSIFVVKPSRLRMIDYHTKEKIVTLYHTFNPFRNKHSNKETYSTREIARLLCLTKSSVWKIIKEYFEKKKRDNEFEYDRQILRDG